MPDPQPTPPNSRHGAEVVAMARRFGRAELLRRHPDRAVAAAANAPAPESAVARRSTIPVGADHDAVRTHLSQYVQRSARKAASERASALAGLPEPWRVLATARTRQLHDVFVAIGVRTAARALSGCEPEAMVRQLSRLQRGTGRAVLQWIGTAPARAGASVADSATPAPLEGAAMRSPSLAAAFLEAVATGGGDDAMDSLGRRVLATSAALLSPSEREALGLCGRFSCLPGVVQRTSPIAVDDIFGPAHARDIVRAALIQPATP